MTEVVFMCACVSLCACTCCFMYVGSIYCVCVCKELYYAACTIRQFLMHVSMLVSSQEKQQHLWTPLPSCQCVKMERVLLLKGMRGAGVIGHDCYQTFTHPVIMDDNRFFIISPCFHGCFTPTVM